MKNALTFLLVLTITLPVIMSALIWELHWPFFISVAVAFVVAALFAEYARRLSKDKSRL